MNVRNGTTSQEGIDKLILGNNVATGTASNRRGYINLYGNTAYMHSISNSPTANRNVTLPDLAGVIPIRQSATIATETNGWYKVDFGAFTMYYKNGEVSNQSFDANAWGWGANLAGGSWLNLPSGITFSSSKMAFNGTIRSGDAAISWSCSCTSGTRIAASWRNKYSGALTASTSYNFVLIVFP